MKVTIFGSGYVGLVTGACLAEVGNQVVCIDIDEAKIAQLNNGQVPIHEPGLDEMIRSSVAAGRLRFSSDLATGVQHGLYQFIAVGTPPDEDGSADLSHVLSVARTIGQHMDQERILITKSTVPVGTCDRIREVLVECMESRGRQVAFDVVSNPEFLKEGAAIEDFMKPDRIIVGTETPRSAELLKALYAPFNRNHDRVMVMSVRSAELTKYAANGMLATKISFMNEIARLAELFGADVEDIRRGIGADPRVGYQFIYPGCGYGGSCFPKDVRALAQSARSVQYTARLIEAVEEVNNDQKHILFERMRSHFGGNLSGRTFAIWGLAFKPNTDDMREAPSRVLMESLWDAGARVRAFDPVASGEAQRLYGDREDLTLCADPYEALDGADALAICTEWMSFRSPDFERMASALREPVIFDGRNLYPPEIMSQMGITYYGIGCGASVKSEA